MKLDISRYTMVFVSNSIFRPSVEKGNLRDSSREFFLNSSFVILINFFPSKDASNAGRRNRYGKHKTILFISFDDI